jgi:hypothetical protein
MQEREDAWKAFWLKWPYSIGKPQIKEAFEAGWDAALNWLQSGANPHDHDIHGASCNGMSPCDMATGEEERDD